MQNQIIFLYSSKGAMWYIRYEEKNQKVKTRKGWGWVGFEDVIEKLKLWDYTTISNRKWWYEHQKILIIQIDGYPFEVPCKELPSWDILLITMYPSRKAKQFILPFTHD